MTDEETEAPRHVSSRRINGWLVLYGPEFARSYEQLRDEVRKLKSALSTEAFQHHATVKLFAHIRRFVRELVPADPNAPDFMLGGGLARFRRGKGHGIPDRYRIIWVFSTKRRVIIFLYLNDESTLRKAGASTDPYEVFRRLLHQGEVGVDFEANYRAWLRANPDLSEAVVGEAGPPEAGEEPAKRRSQTGRRTARRREQG